MKKIIILIIQIVVSLNIFGHTIAEIQGTSHKSPYENKFVKDVEGVVLKNFDDRFNDGFFIQSLKDDGNPITSEGIYIDKSDFKDTKFKEGDLVRVDGIVKELQFQKFDKKELTITAIKALDIKVLKKGLTIEPTIIEASKIPFKIHDDDTPVDKLDPINNAMDYYETFESMLVKVISPKVVGVKERHGDIAVVPEKGDYVVQKTKNGGLRYTYDNEQTQKIIISNNYFPLTNSKKIFKDKNFTPNPGDQFLGDIEGILTFNFGTYRIMNTKKLPKLEDSATKPDENKLGIDKEKLSIVSYNIENFSLADDKYKVYDLAKQVKNILKTPDIISLIELGDDNGSDEKRYPRETAGAANLKAIIREIKRETGVEYGYLMINPKHGRDGGKPAIHIRNAILYRKDRVQIPYLNEGLQDKDTYVVDGKLLYNPGRIGTESDAFEAVRKSLVGHFLFKGKDIFIIVNHLSSKREDNGLYGAIRPIHRKSEEKRHLQAELIFKFHETLHNNFKDAIIVSLGDMNDFEFSKTVSIMKGDIMFNAVDLLPEEERYSYVYQGNSQILDNVLVNKEYIDKTKVDIINVNSEFTHSQGAFSDHDPVYIEIDVK
ncbi:endonuclease/exonuclease/phosphatase family protein [Oceanivirga salmonicida]|uniref:endonuclease/exonuclease/phosphatase family protein n=1 Tax=Oceanivirga salmonicida TaxID=1769291 RepID=UPI00082CA8D4|nr:hypothetical protein [Oceanivirga salmonicida]